MRLIDANALKALFDERYDDAFMQMHTRPNIAHWEGVSIGVNWGRNTIADAPTVDAVEVVRCRECANGYVSSGSSTGMRCKKWGCYDTDCECRPDGFCSYRERRE